MYSLDINFLNDRPEYKPDAGGRGTKKAPVISSDSKRPLYLGIAAAVFFPLVVGALWGFLSYRNGELEQQSAALDSQLTNLEARKKELESINAQITQTKTEAGALATVFNQIKPWSALSQDVRDRNPTGVRILQIKQVQPAPGTVPSPAPAASPAPGATPAAPPQPPVLLQISGVANTFNDVNDFLLTLQRSDFLQSDQTKLVNAQLEAQSPSLRPLELADRPGGGSGGQSDRLPKLPRRVDFTILTALTQAPASDLIRELDRKGAVGLVTRIEALKSKGVIQP